MMKTRLPSNIARNARPWNHAPSKSLFTAQPTSSGKLSTNKEDAQAKVSAKEGPISAGWYEQWESLSGVKEISGLKEAVAESSDRLQRQTATVHQLRQATHQQAAAHEALSRQHASMMHHREAWQEMDVHEFARLTAAEGRARAVAEQGRRDLATAEEELHEAQIAYIDNLRKRYHEEQVWQDKWRILGTYWTWGLIALNSVVFLSGQYLHYMREEKRLQKIQDMLQDFKTSSDALAAMNTGMIEATGTESVESKRFVEQKEAPSSEVEAKQDIVVARDSWASKEGDTTAKNEDYWSAKEAAEKPRDDRENRTWKGRLQNYRQMSIDFCRRPRLGLPKPWREQMELLHWPSVAVGAVATSLGIIMVSSIQRK
jgi:hypothetical protein